MKSVFSLVAWLALTCILFVGLNAQPNIISDIQETNKALNVSPLSNNAVALSSDNSSEMEMMRVIRGDLEYIQKTLAAIRYSYDPSLIAKTGSVLGTVIRELVYIVGALGLGIGCAWLVFEKMYDNHSKNLTEAMSALMQGFRQSESEITKKQSTFVTLIVVGIVLAYITERIIGKLLTSSPQNSRQVDESLLHVECVLETIDSQIQGIKQLQKNAHLISQS